MPSLLSGLIKRMRAHVDGSRQERKNKRRTAWMTDVPIHIETRNRIKNNNENDVLHDEKHRDDARLIRSFHSIACHPTLFLFLYFFFSESNHSFLLLKLISC